MPSTPPASRPYPRPRFDLIIADVDGCLTPEGPHPFDLHALAQIAAHNKAAFTRPVPPASQLSGFESPSPNPDPLAPLPPITLCTGRPQPFAEALCRLIHNTSIPCVCENGVWLYHPGTNDYSLDPAITHDHLAAVRDAEDWVRKTLYPRGVSIQPGKLASISLYHPDPDYLRNEIRPIVEREFESRAAGGSDASGANGERGGWPLRVSMTWLYINCDLKHISKSTGLDRLIERVGIPRDRLAGIGDTPSDLAIRDRVAYFACPNNAHEEIKAAANYIAPRPEAQGVLDILNHLAP